MKLALGWWCAIYSDELKFRICNKVKEDVFKAQRMYYLALKLENRIPECLRQFSMDVLDKYTKKAKDIDMQLTSSELYQRILGSSNDDE